MNELVNLNTNIDFLDLELLDQDLFVADYKTYLVRELAGGDPSGDTIASYFSAINQFLKWCGGVERKPLELKEYHLLAYRQTLWQHNYAATSVAFKLTAVRRFYHCALKLDLIKDNPMKDVHAKKDPDASDPEIQYLTAAQLEILIRSIPIDTEEYFRDRLMIIFMGIEGLRTVEVSRMNLEDVNFALGTIYIRGKGHNDLIYPREDVLEALQLYVNMKEYPTRKDKHGTPVFSVVSNNNTHFRISRQAIRDAIDYWFEKNNIKAPGLSCHLLRHTCGTLLYAETKDLQVVKETLRHRDLKMSSKYAHLQNRMLNRYTKAIPVKIT